ncbi:MAG: hypothetical protein HFI19_06610 [Lachnospiraceae bacterium]|nr:hypothetical protein [Lachnospiraceae bacterium]
MKKQLTGEEQLIECFIEKFENKNSLDISISCKDADKLNMPEKEVMQYIAIMEDRKWLRVTKKSVHNDLSIPCNIHLDSTCIDYFKNKQVHNKQTRKEFWNEFRAWITLIIALIALIHSIYSTGSKNVSSQPLDASVPGSAPLVTDAQVHDP